MALDPLCEIERRERHGGILLIAQTPDLAQY
jgi:hypothetical protein